ncbi:cytochrome o ubiquinol oxidase subunit III [Agrobacterium sp. B1(2019)]|uniref:cytochrome o ubiquinol oxidase subunit III n=1 Tax=Agrobacterium sp. B1(2019) TaxID=2607032 RepID=UPI0011EF5ACD|nr:cytochrome o ubiquinol oxidase subunit III [Agrobacterium sp. B1(2019)]TZG36023.1 cytochrome o ubiquinol oxidase subunit III [Agrobacterium sp. B1(2019)]
MTETDYKGTSLAHGSDVDSSRREGDEGTFIGFWFYLMSDCLIFAVLFAVYAVLGRSFAGGPEPTHIFDLRLLAANTAILLLSSLAYGMGMLRVEADQAGRAVIWLVAAGILGLAFLTLEVSEFAGLIAAGAGPERSAFLSSFFVLVGTHGLHVLVGLLWLVTLLAQVARHGLISANKRRLQCLGMFWHFLDVIWVGVFSFVYLSGMVQ